ncbi:2,4-dienoyl-CoA reductase-like NADH-dependent reductase (Old Yellow Enzyme family) [Variovorax boronicumulans]|uniref:hypothetical protein n=1 Tax=Variovorax boronicumulans TaxID=436515 RepID=UPI0024770392|nr:hypothetical protein [Variovorax boronicumulans]MDH6168759.1 2,4-dienoyl-CoA reductase-like NADH-dependent reductase (Old Yellow Enzyme family) [Variovorax boronicumulans]
MPGLFDSFTLKQITLRNRIAASPMCQYQAKDGPITDAKDADRAVRENKVDFVMVARRLLDNPHWPRQAARELGVVEQVLPTPYAYWLQNWSPRPEPTLPVAAREPA